MVDRNSIIQEAASALKEGKLVAFPTETVYGLGADAKNPQALARLYQLKGRPTSHPSIVHISDIEQLSQWCQELPAAALLLAQKFWPGPLTLVLKKAAHVLPELTGGQDTVAIRMPAHETALALLAAFGSGVAAPSANRFGHLSPTSAQAVKDEFGSDLSVVLDGGRCQVGIESTILDLSSNQPMILRPGMIKSDQIALALSELSLKLEEKQASSQAPRVPGSLAAHYAPRTALNLVRAEILSDVIAELSKQKKKIAVLATQKNIATAQNWIVASCDSAVYAQDLYHHLRTLDQACADIILVEIPPQTDEWTGINDRLKRAAAEQGTSGEETDGC
ncbi:MAG: threonylcarbamoyl-AMP synthase [Candidatus Obscuribacterales bacterium]|nr:threonylcarbamoyl-AMP synthase [Candidatus Obscuribacterales bacterium]